MLISEFKHETTTKIIHTLFIHSPLGSSVCVTCLKYNLRYRYRSPN